MSNQYGYQGTETAESSGTQYNAIEFIAQMLINSMATCTLVQVVSVTNSGGLSPTGLVDIRPLINQLDGFGNPTPHNIIHNCPYFRMQGGSNAIILDPQVGDLGIAVFCDKDISNIIAAQLANNGDTPSLANPGSFRRFSFSDGLYIGGILNGVPTQYIQFNGSGITLHSPTEVTISAPNILLNGAVIANSTIVANTSVTSPIISGTTDVQFNGKSTDTHTHPVTSAPGDTGAPN